MEKFYKISDFAQKIGRHANTVDAWFKKMEQQRVHYVNRVENEKIYDELDLKIAYYIRDKREEGWALRAIFNDLEEHFELRSFPDSMQDNLPLDFEAVRRRFSEDMRALIDEAVRVQVEATVKIQVEAAVSEVKRQYEEVLKQLPKAEDFVRQLPRPRDPLEERQERMTELITIERVKSKLRQEALQLWATKPEEERMKRTGIWGLKKEEDHGKRDLFVSNYVDEHLVSRLEKERLPDKAYEDYTK